MLVINKQQLTCRLDLYARERRGEVPRAADEVGSIEQLSSKMQFNA